MLECCQNEYYCDYCDSIGKSYFGFKGFIQSRRENRELFYKKYSHVNLDGIDEYNLTDEEAFCIYSYTTSGCDWLNRDIKNKKRLSMCKESYAQCLDKYLDKIPPFDKEYIFRMDIPDEYQIQKWKKMKIGEVLQITHFLSCSKENWDEESTDRSWIVWKIKTLASNSNARDISNITNVEEEREVLFKRDSYFKVETIDISKKVVELVEVERSLNPIFI